MYDAGGANHKELNRLPANRDERKNYEKLQNQA